MRIILTLSFIILSVIGYTQNWQPINSFPKKVFKFLDGSGQTADVVIDSTLGTANDSTYYNYRKFVSTTNMFPDTCVFWGGGCLIRREGISFFGEMTTVDSTNISTFNYLGDTLTFPRVITLNDTVEVFNNGSEVLLAHGYYKDTLTILGLIDSVEVIQLLHQDVAGIPITGSLIHGYSLTNSKNHGLVSWIDTWNFPAQLSPVEIAATTQDSLGLVFITEADIHHTTVGDKFQIRRVDVSYPWGTMGPSEVVDTLYLYEVSSIVETSTDLTISYDINVGLGSSTVTYSKLNIVAEIPYNDVGAFPNPGWLNCRRLVWNDSCGGEMFQLYHEQDIMAYCPSQDCWGGVDDFGMCLFEKKQDHLGIKRLNSAYTSLQPGCESTSYYLESLVYVERAGGSCGHYYNSITAVESNFKTALYPNPASGIFNFELSSYKPGRKLIVLNALGQVIMKEAFYSTKLSIELNKSKGVYLYLIMEDDAILANGKLVVD